MVRPHVNKQHFFCVCVDTREVYIFFILLHCVRGKSNPSSRLSFPVNTNGKIVANATF